LISKQEHIDSRSYTRQAVLVIVLFFVMKAIVAFTMELGGDEAYYWLYSQDLKMNYFDHPPMVGLWIRLFTANLSLQYIEGFVRLGSLLGCAISSWFIFKTCSILHSERAGFIGVCLYNISIYSAITAGLLIMPDSPQMVFYTASLLLLVYITTNENKWTYWILFGLAAGLCIMSKVHGVFTWVGLGLYIIFNKRKWLLKPQLYVALLVSLIISMPILLWNIQYDFATYKFHGDRVTIHDGTINAYSFGREIISQLFFNNPFNVLLIIAALFAYKKNKLTRLEALSIFNFIGISLAGLLLLISLFRDTTLPHWSGPAYIALIPLAAIHLARKRNVGRLPLMVKASIAGFIIALIGWQILLYGYPGTYGSTNDFILGKGDVSIDKYGRKKAGETFNKWYTKEVAVGMFPANTPVVYYKWWAAHIDYYFCHPNNIQMIGLGDMNNLHEYMWMNNIRSQKVNLSTAICITPSEDRDDMQEHYSPYYERIDSVSVIKSYRNKKQVRNFFIYRLSGWKNNLPVMK
jgi:hypothetical protein